MNAVSPKIIAEAQKFKPDNVVIMFELDMRNSGGSIFRFTAEIGGEQDLLKETGESFKLEDGTTNIELENAATAPVFWRGDDFVPLPAFAEGFEMSASGSFARPSLTVADVLGILRPEMIARNNLSGATVTRWRTFAKHLDNGADPDPDIYFPPDIYKIERKASDDGIWVTFELSTVIDQEGVLLPRRQILRNTCTHIYRTWDDEAQEWDYSKATCPYSGDQYFDENGVQVSFPKYDVASKLTETCCKRRFKNQALPTRAFPGVGRFR